MRHLRQHHEPAVAAAEHGQAFWVALLLIAQPVRGVGQVLHRIHALRRVVEIHVGRAVAGRAADVRREDGVTGLDEILKDRVETRPRLAFGAAVRIDNHGRQAIGFLSGRIKPGRDFAVVEGFVMDQFRHHEF